MPEPFTIEKVLAVAAAIAGGLATGGVIGVALVRFLFRDWVKWRERVEAKIDRLQPEHILKLEGIDPERLEQHYSRVHGLANTAAKCEMSVERHERLLADHEARLRVVEARRP